MVPWTCAVVKESVASDTMPAYPGSVLIAWQQGLKCVWLYLFKYFRKAVSAVMDDLVKCAGKQDHRQLTPNNYNLISKIDYLNNNP